MNKEVIIIEDLNKYLFKSNINYKLKKITNIFFECIYVRTQIIVIAYL